MSTGTVKWFNNQKGFGFIQPENGDNGALQVEGDRAIAGAGLQVCLPMREKA